METMDSEIATQIRGDIMRGTCAEGEKLSEAKLCATHNLSRTPVRPALRIPERARDARMTLADLVAYSAADLTHPLN